MSNFGRGQSVADACKVRAFLENFAKRRTPITYQELAKALQISPPHSIHQVTEALERLMEEDAAADRPFIAALVISKARGGLPAPGFFDCARRLGRFAGIRTARTQGRFTPPSCTPSSLAGAVRATTNDEISCSPKSQPLTGAADCPDPQHSQWLSRCPAAAIRCS